MKVKFSTLTTIFALLLVTVLIALVIVACRAESETDSKIYVLCSPTSGVYLRTRPDKNAPSAGYAEAGFALKTDGKIRNGWYHLIDVPGEYSECWIYCGYISTTEPEWLKGCPAMVIGEGRVACRKWCQGKQYEGHAAWVRPGDEVQVFYRTPEWCVTNRGFIRTEFLEVYEAEVPDLW